MKDTRHHFAWIDGWRMGRRVGSGFQPSKKVSCQNHADAISRCRPSTENSAGPGSVQFRGAKIPETRHQFAGSAQKHARDPNMVAREPHLVNREPHLAGREPYLCARDTNLCPRMRHKAARGTHFGKKSHSRATMRASRPAWRASPLPQRVRRAQVRNHRAPWSISRMS